MPQRALALLMQAMGNAHQPHPIAQLMLQGTCDAAAQIGSWCGGKCGWHWPQAAVAGPELKRPPDRRSVIPDGSVGFFRFAQVHPIGGSEIVVGRVVALQRQIDFGGHQEASGVPTAG
ncbi:MAG: hypothetical protein VKJ05_04090, partial [Synechococcaceae cyanobacterium]|nr:hypothetical protein [Synechococcaceae cyanobacterium]